MTQSPYGPNPAQVKALGVATPNQPDDEPSPPAPGWGWRSLVAFVAGGLLALAGFAVAQISDDSGQDEAAGQVTVGSQTPAPSSVNPSPSPQADVDRGVEPAAEVATKLGPSVVQIRSDRGIGSGVVYKQGLIITNNHVIEGSTQVLVRTSDGRTIEGEVVGSEPTIDIAVIAVGASHDLPPAELLVGQPALVGQTAIAIGSPFELQQTVTEGIVSAVNRPVFNGDRFISMIQTDAPINPGNSGGALADRDGRVIGINTAIQTDGSTSSNAGVGFAIPVRRAVDVADRLVEGQPIVPGFLGIQGGQASDGAAGVEVMEVTAGTPAEASGIRLGDRIVAVDGAPVTRIEELAGVVSAYAPGDEVEVELIRDGVAMSITAILGSRPDS